MKKHRSQTGFAHLLLIFILAMAVIVVAVFVFSKVFKSKKAGEGNISSWTDGCKSAERIKFTHTPMDIADINTISPMGLTAGAHVTPIDHLYFYPKAQERDAIPVYAMADGTIIEISERTMNVDSGTSKAGEFRLVMQHSCQTISYFDLVTSLDPAISSEFKNGVLKSPIAIKAGQVIGRIGGQSLDTAVYNMNLTLPGFIHPDMYKAEPWKVHSDDFFNYFDDPLRSQFLELNTRKVEPYSGKIDYDLPGKLIGNWFVEGTNGYAGPKTDQKAGSNGRGYWSGHLSIHYGPTDGKSIIISVGSFGENGQPQAFGVVGNTPDPATITTSSGIVKYELIETITGVVSGPQNASPMPGAPNPVKPVKGVALFQVLDGEKLKVEIVAGKKGGDVAGFSSAANVYER